MGHQKKGEIVRIIQQVIIRPPLILSILASCHFSQYRPAKELIAYVPILPQEVVLLKPVDVVENNRKEGIKKGVIKLLL